MKLHIACALLAAGMPVLAPAGTVVNPVSQFPITVDGQFTNNLEWSDVNKLAFISTNTQLTAVDPTNPNNAIDPMASVALFSIDPLAGTLTANSTIPEPTTFFLAGLGLIGIGLIARRKR
jgi:hypothetical protein